MAKGNTFINDLHKLIFNATAITNIADNASSSPLTNLYMALHTADPGAGGSQTTSEAAYSGYARVAVARTSGGFTVTTVSVALTAAVTFAQAPTSATDVVKFWSVGTASSGTGKVIYSGPIGSNLGAGTAVAATDTITIPGLTGVAVADQIAFLAPTGGTLPTGITSGTVYYVKTLSTNDITISTTSGGSTLDITAAGQLFCYHVTPIVTGGGVKVTPQLDTNTTITEM